MRIRRSSAPVDGTGRTRQSGLWWLGSLYPISKEIGDGIKYAQKQGWPIRIHLEPPNHVAFYVDVPAGVIPPDFWLRTMAPDTINLAHR